MCTMVGKQWSASSGALRQKPPQSRLRIMIELDEAALVVIGQTASG